MKTSFPENLTPAIFISRKGCSCTFYTELSKISFSQQLSAKELLLLKILAKKDLKNSKSLEKNQHLYDRMSWSMKKVKPPVSSRGCITTHLTAIKRCKVVAIPQLDLDQPTLVYMKPTNPPTHPQNPPTHCTSSISSPSLPNPSHPSPLHSSPQYPQFTPVSLFVERAAAAELSLQCNGAQLFTIASFFHPAQSGHTLAPAV